MKPLEIFSEIVSWSVLIYILVSAMQSNCFFVFDWILVSIALIFSYIVRYISRIRGIRIEIKE